MDNILIKIRRTDSNQNSYYEEFEYEGDMNIPVTTLLENISNQTQIINENGEMSSPVEYDSSCLQGLCGSCAMVINDMPQLACKTFLNDVVQNNQITIEPLFKFPVVKDLKVDRTQMYETLKQMQLWLEDEASINKNDVNFEYEMSQCLMCGCCLEACPNYMPDDKYVGVHAVVNGAKLLNQEQDSEHIKKMKKYYKNNFYPNCVKSLLCQDVCPMNIPTQKAISKMNKNSIWWFWQLLNK